MILVWSSTEDAVLLVPEVPFVLRPESPAPDRRDLPPRVEDFLSLVPRIVARAASRAPTHIDRDDLTQVAHIELMRLIPRITNAATATGFVYRRLYGAVQDELRRMDWCPRRQRTQLREVQAVEQRLEQEHQRPILPAELAAAAGLKSVQELETLRAPGGTISIDAVNDTESGGTLANTLPAETARPSQALETGERMQGLLAAVQSLEGRDRQIVELYYFEGRKFCEIAALLNVTESRICQLHARLLPQLRRVLERQDKPVTPAVALPRLPKAPRPDKPPTPSALPPLAASPRPKAPKPPTPTTPVPTDAELVARLRDRDVRALEIVMQQHQSYLHNVVLNFLNNGHDAEEIVSIVFQRTWKAIDRFRGDSSLRTWLHCIATNLARNRYWHRKRRGYEVNQSLDAVVGDSGRTLADFQAADDSPAHRQMETVELQVAAQAALRLLSPTHRKILHLRNDLHLGYESIATRLGISVGTVKSRLARARTCLRAALEADAPGGHSLDY